MTEQDDKEIGAKLLAIANVTRKAVLIGRRKITEAIDASPYDEYELSTLIEFADMLMKGYHKEHIVESLKISPELVEKFDKVIDW